MKAKGKGQKVINQKAKIEAVFQSSPLLRCFFSLSIFDLCLLTFAF
jgi:hypothetical protein